MKREGGGEERGRKGKQCKWRVMEEEPQARRGKGGRDGESEKESEREWRKEETKEGGQDRKRRGWETERREEM